jgi:cephalosporin hydroxylase
MTTKDDRLEFEAHKREMSLALGKDEASFQQSLNTLIGLDKFDYFYLWSWMGVPIIQLPVDILATQEVIWATKPDVIIETGIARGGSLIFMASILAAMGNDKAKVVGVDIDIRAHNRESIESHPMSNRIKMIQGGSVDDDVLAAVKAEIPPGARVMVVLDSDHSYEHVLAECRAYGPLVTEGCYLVVADTLKMQLELLRDGYSNALTGQRPFEMGEKSMDTLLAIKKGQKVPEIIYTGLDLVTKDNVAQLLK